jgi:DNA-binding CsgD family transcriptional regulator
MAQRVLARFTATDTRVLLRDSAPARALRQALVEGDPIAARSTVLTRLADEELDPHRAGEAFAAYALANIIDANPAAWRDFIQACAAASVELHPDIVEIATSHGAPNLGRETQLDAPTPADRRGWAQLAGCISTVKRAFRELRSGSAIPPAELTTPVGNRLVRLISATWVSVMLAHNLLWRELETALALAQDSADTVPAPLMQANAETLRALFDAFRGESNAARERLNRVRSEPVVRRSPRLRLVQDSVEAMIEGPQGNHEYALALLSTRQPDVSYLISGPAGLTELFDFVDYALLLHQHEEAVARVEHAREILSPFPSERVAFILAACDAAIATRSTLTPAEDLLARAQTLPFVYESARLRLVYAERLRKLGRTAEARRQLLRVEVEFKTVQAGAWLDRVQRELRACQRGTVTHVADLTEQESRIAELAAGGLSNKEIGIRLHLSPRTVGGYLYKVFPKLGITTRAQLRDALASAKSDENEVPQETVAGAGHDPATSRL